MFVDITHIDDAFKDYVYNRLFPMFKLTVGECRMELPLIGRKSCIRFLRTSSGADFAIRAFLRSQIKDAKILISCQEFLEKERIPVPHVVDFVEKFSSKGVSFLTEEYLQGESWETLKHSPEMARKLGTLLSQLHLLESKSWGSFGRLFKKGNGFGNSQLGWVKNRLYRVRKFVKNDIPSAEFTEVRKWFCNHVTLMNRMENFQLIHNKINRGNVIWCPEKFAMYLLDFSTLQYGYRGKDIVQAEWALLKNKTELVAEFQEEYFRHFSKEVWEQYRILAPFYHAYYHLSKCAASLRRDFEKKNRKNGESQDLYKKFLRHWKTLLILVRKP